MAWRAGGWWIAIAGAASPLLMLGGCVNVTAPNKPIEINLNVTITQDVVLRLDNDAKALIKDNPGIF